MIVQDNLPIANYGSLINGRDIGIMGSRTISDIINDPADKSGTADGGTISTITFDAGESSVDDFYNGYVLHITGGTGSGQVKNIVDYVGSTRIATLDSNWAITPDNTSDYELFCRRNVAIYYDANVDEFILGHTPDPHTNNNINVKPGTLHIGDLIIDGSISGAGEIVTLPDNSGIRVDIPSTDARGSYLIIVESLENDGATATFAVSSNEDSSAGVVQRITSIPGALDEEIDVDWLAGEQVQLYHSTTRTGGTGVLLDYSVRVVDMNVAGGEITVAQNVGTDGVGPYDSKLGNILQFRNIAAGSNLVSVAFDGLDNDIDININEGNLTLDNLGGVLSVSKGGTSLNTLTLGRFLVGNGIGAVDLTKVVPSGDVVGTIDTQILTNKTAIDASNNLISRGLWYGSGSGFVSTYASGTPSIGDVLVATSATTADWQSTSATYGGEFEIIESLGPISTTLEISILAGAVIGGSTKVSWTTASKPIGTYRIDWSYDWTNNSNSRDLIAVITEDGSALANIKHQFRSGVTSNAGGFDTADFAITSSGTDQRHNSSGFFYSTYGVSTTHTLNVVFGRGGSGAGFDAVTISDLRLQIIRVS